MTEAVGETCLCFECAGRGMVDAFATAAQASLESRAVFAQIVQKPCRAPGILPAKACCALGCQIGYGL